MHTFLIDRMLEQYCNNLFFFRKYIDINVLTNHFGFAYLGHRIRKPPPPHQQTLCCVRFPQIHKPQNWVTFHSARNPPKIGFPPLSLKSPKNYVGVVPFVLRPQKLGFPPLSPKSQNIYGFPPLSLNTPKKIGFPLLSFINPKMSPLPRHPICGPAPDLTVPVF